MLLRASTSPARAETCLQYHLVSEHVLMLLLRTRNYPKEAVRRDESREGRQVCGKVIRPCITRMYTCPRANLQTISGTMPHCFSPVVSLFLLLCNVRAGFAQGWNCSLRLVGSPQDSARTFISEASMACAPQDPRAAPSQTLTAYVAESLLFHQSSFTGKLEPLRLRLYAPDPAFQLHSFPCSRC